jgi:predicted phosphodiesterase
MAARQKLILAGGGIGLLLLGLLGGILWANTLEPEPKSSLVQQPAVNTKTIVVTGDIACEAGDIKTIFTCRHEDTAKLVESIKPAAVLVAGDIQYPKGTLASFQNGYDKTWGKFKSITYPVPGNHEYATPGAAGYFDYFGERAGERGKGYYAFTVGDWRMIALNSEIDVSKDSEQLQWLSQELEQQGTACTLAYWHKPRFSTGSHASDPTFDALWRVLYEHNVDIVVNGHSHNYERFIPQNPDGAYDERRGIVQFVSGMGGRSPGPMGDSTPTLVTRQNHSFGVLKLTLFPKSANYEFVPVSSLQSYTDNGTVACR